MAQLIDQSHPDTGAKGAGNNGQGTTCPIGLRTRIRRNSISMLLEIDGQKAAHIRDVMWGAVAVVTRPSCQIHPPVCSCLETV
jgi:hypothetical protein